MPVNDSFQNLVDDLTQQALAQAQESIHNSISELVNQKLDSMLSAETINRLVISRVEQQLHQYTPDLSNFEAGLQAVSDNILHGLDATANKKITQHISELIQGIDVSALVYQSIESRLQQHNYKIPFAAHSIMGSAIDPTELKISGDNIVGGVVTNFASTGIDDQSATCQLTLLDQGAVFENTIYASKLEVKGGAVIDGDLTILGNITDNPAYQKLVTDTSSNVQTNIGPAILDAYQDRVFERIQQEGLDLNKIKIDGVSIVEGDKLTGAVRHSQLQSVGVIRDLQTDGEALLSQTLYVSNRRVGVNTMDPNTALSVWDEEIEIGLGKQSQSTARIGTVRDHTMILGTNKQDNITLTPDGVATIPKLRIGNMLFSSSSTPPNYDAPRNTVVFNEFPNIGGPLGWVSLGDARWANFGVID
jgi:hypothetical protein